MSITKDQWLQVQQALGTPYGRAKLVCDGYDVSLQVMPRGNLKFEILPYINGWAKGEWGLNDCEERRRFLRLRTARLFTAKDVARMAKGLSKTAIKKYLPDLDKTFAYYSLMWPSFMPLKRHLIENNKVIEFVERSFI